MQVIKAEKLTSDAFARFGKVIEAADHVQSVEINSGTCLKFPNLAMPDCTMDRGQVSIHIYRAKPLDFPIVVKGLERHVCGTQAFVPLSGRPFLVVVAPVGDFELQEVRVFRAEGSQGVQYDRGTWHHFCLALEAESEFLVVDRLSSTPDCEEVHLSRDEQFVIAL